MYRTLATTRTSSLKDVPEDVWRSIFGIVLSQTLEPQAKTNATLRLAHVCAFWNHIITNAPELWTTVHLCTLEHSNKAFPNTDLLSLILQNSRNMPLTMHIAIQKALSAESVAVKSAWKFFQQSHRADTLQLEYESLERFFTYAGDDAILEILRPKTSGSPWLRTLSIDFAGSSYPRASLLSRIWTPAPLLRTLSIGGKLDFNTIQSLPKAKFPFHQLTNLTVTSDIKVKDLFLFLSSATSLINAGFHRVLGTCPPRSSQSDAFHLPNLSVLELNGEGDEEAICPPLSEVLAYIEAPSLKHLKLKADRDWSQSSFERFISNSCCKIEHLHLDVVDSSAAEKLECLKRLPSLRSLDIGMEYDRGADCPNYFEEELAQALRERNAETGEFLLCPHLRKFVLDYDALYVTDTTLFADFVEDRWRKLPDFEVHIHSAGRLAREPMQLCEVIRLLSLKRSGLNVTIDPEPFWESLICRV
ncbi:hypothetical protein CVT26_011774 [Gymnopilus dilepis]|uniref:F-box domain-containing protein n=1 Tax=Gymnopilus dilepis TaxID=231916 RepID=A0A409W914_9AGAR|nr:hypothetical protein CVT26_011774 [Gymnopilus dilepis]